LLGEGLAHVASGRQVSVVPRQAPRPRVPVAVSTIEDEPAELVLDVAGLSVVFPAAGGDIVAVRDLDLTVRRGELVGIVGESGSGKTVTALAVAQLVSYPGQVTFERFRFDSRDVLEFSPGERRRVLGTSLPMVFQNPGTTMNPASRVGRQLAEVAEVHESMSRSAATKRAVDKLRQVAIAAPERRLRAYSHELSGGMKQRAVIAMGLMGKPKLFIADEPTTALDVTVQRQIFDVLRQVHQDEGASVLLISHDIAAVSELCSRIIVMYAGRIVEEADVSRVVSGAAAHPARAVRSPRAARMPTHAAWPSDRRSTRSTTVGASPAGTRGRAARNWTTERLRDRESSDGSRCHGAIRRRTPGDHRCRQRQPRRARWWRGRSRGRVRLRKVDVGEGDRRIGRAGRGSGLARRRDDLRQGP
jgi:peptide/nickel transport system permease protein